MQLVGEDYSFICLLEVQVDQKTLFWCQAALENGLTELRCLESKLEVALLT